MAGKFLSIEDEELDLSCPICFEDYQLLDINRQPKILLCLHTFCYSCLKAILRLDSTLQCSICRADHQITRISDLMDNNAINQHLRKKQELADRNYSLRVAQGKDTESSESENEEEEDDDKETGSVVAIEGSSPEDIRRRNISSQLREISGLFARVIETMSRRENEAQQPEGEQHQQQTQLQESERHRQQLEQQRTQQLQLQQPHRPQQQDTATATAPVIRSTGESSINDRKVFVGGISLNATDSQLLEYFSKFGAVQEIIIKCGYGFIVFTEPQAVNKSLGWHEIYGNRCEVKKYKPRDFKIVVSNITGIAEADVKAYFGRFGPIKIFSRPSQNFCFLSYKRESEMFEALRNPLPEAFGRRFHVNRFNHAKWYFD